MIGRRGVLKGAAAMVAGGNPRQRPDQLVQPLSRAGVGPAPAPSVIVARKVIIIGTLGELLVYSPTETAGDLIAAIAAAGGSDGLGNSFVQGIGSYNQGAGTGTVLNGGNIEFLYSIASNREYAFTEPTTLGAGNPPALEFAVETGFIIASAFFNTDAVVWLAPSGDNTGVADSANLAAAFALTKYVQLLPGTFWLDTELQPPADSTLAGCGVDVTIINQLSASGHGIYYNSFSNITLRDFTLAGPGDVFGTNDGIHFDGASAINNISLDSLKVRLFGNYGIFATDIITSSLRNVEVQQVANHGIVLQNGTSVALDGCYVNNQSGFGYFLNGMSYCSLNGCACDFGQWGYFLEGCFDITLQGCGCESQTIGGFKLDGGTGYTLTGCLNFKNPGVAFLVTASTVNAVLSGCMERNPTGTATASFEVDAGSAATLIQPAYTTAPSPAAPADATIWSVRADGNLYVTGALSLTTTGAGQLVNSATPAPVTGLSGIAIPAAGTYRVRGQVYWLQNVAAVSQGFGFQGANLGAGTRVLCSVLPTTGAANSVNNFQLINDTAGITSNGFAAGGTVYVISFEGTLVFTAADTFGLEVSAPVAADTWTVEAGSWLDVMPA